MPFNGGRKDVEVEAACGTAGFGGRRFRGGGGGAAGEIGGGRVRQAAQRQGGAAAPCCPQGRSAGSLASSGARGRFSPVISRGKNFN